MLYREVVPALVNVLSDTRFSTRLVATASLGHYGTNAQQAVPALVRLLSDPDARVRLAATGALRDIGPEPAARPGVQW